MIIGGVAIVLVVDKLWSGEGENMTREELNAVRGYVSNIQAIKDAHNTEQLPINYGTICTITANGWKLIEELKALKQEPKTGHWIPCSERLPKTAGVYRVTRYYPNNVLNPNYIVDACYFDGSNTWYDDNRINHERAYADNVIAWQEDPEPYRQESEEA